MGCNSWSSKSFDLPLEALGDYHIYSRVVVAEHIKECGDRTKDRIKWLMDVERRAFTLNTRYYSDYKDKFLSYYRACRETDDDTSQLIKNLQTYRPPAASRLPSTDYQDGMARVLSGLPQVGFSGVKTVDLAKLLPSDPMDSALGIMAGVRAYFQGRVAIPAVIHTLADIQRLQWRTRGSRTSSR